MSRRVSAYCIFSVFIHWALIMTGKPIDKLMFHDAIAALRAESEKIGSVTLKFSNDVEQLEQAHEILGKGETGEHFRRALDTLPPNRFFWLGAYMDGSVIGTVAARCDDSSWPLQRFVKNYWERSFEGEGAARVKVAPDSPEAAADYTGRFAYLGEAVTDEKIRNRNLSYVLVRLAMLIAFDEWKPNVVYGWMRDAHAYRGLATRWGFNRCEPSALEWVVRPAQTDWHNLAFLTCDQAGFHRLMKNPAPAALFQARTNIQAETDRRPWS